LSAAATALAALSVFVWLSLLRFRAGFWR